MICRQEEELQYHPYGYVDFSQKTYTRKNLLLQAVTSRASFQKL